MRKKLLMDYGWRFQKDREVVVTKSDDYFSTYTDYTKTGTVVGPGGIDFSDEYWEKVNLPHDWVIYENFHEKNNRNQGYLPQDVVWYRKNFHINDDYDNKRISFIMDGAAIRAEVYLNSQLIYRSFSGYTEICIDITDFVHFGSRTNCLAIKVDNTEKEGWWYEGGGIYRHTWLVITDQLHIKNHGVYVCPQKIDACLWDVPIETVLENNNDFSCYARLISSIKDKHGNEVATTESGFTCRNNGETTVKQSCSLLAPELWCVNNPVLYTLESKVIYEDKLIDNQITSFGFRTIEFKQDKGFYLNGEPYKIKGACIHHDHAGVGVALPDSIQYYRINRLKEMGCNAIRTAHNPPTNELLEACDCLGMLVMDEVRHLNSAEQGLYELRSLVMRDRNHPSVILWSVFNEEPLQCTKVGEQIVKTMKSEIKKLDKSRPVTGAMNGPLEKSGAVHQVEVMGINYSSHTYDDFCRHYPQLPIIASETGSHQVSRGNYENDPASGHPSAYGIVRGVNLHPWASTPGDAWKPVMERENIAGCFYWTGFDYRGETGPYNWPGVTSNFGCMDLCGFPKDNYYWHQALWLDKPILKISPHWNSKGHEGEQTKVVCYSNCEEVELFLNCRSLGRKSLDDCSMPQWQVEYIPGELKAIGYNGGDAVIWDMEKTTGNAEKIRLECDRHEIKADGQEVCMITVSLLDSDGLFIPDSMEKVWFNIEGPGRIIGVGNGDNASHESDKVSERHLYNGLAMVMVQSELEEGMIILSAKTEHDHIMRAQINLSSKKVDIKPFIPSSPVSFLLETWRMSCISVEKPLPEVIFKRHYTWIPTVVGSGSSLALSGKMGYCSFQGRINVPKLKVDKILVIHFEGILGKAEFFIDRKLIYKKDFQAEAKVTINCPDLIEGEDTDIYVLLELDGNESGITGDVFLKY